MSTTALPTALLDLIVHRFRQIRGDHTPTWSAKEHRCVASARTALRKLGRADPIDALFHALECCAPLDGGIVETVHDSRPLEIVDAHYAVPDAFVTNRSSLIRNDPGIPLTQRIPIGLAGGDIHGMPQPILDKLPYMQAMYPHFGVAHVTGMKVLIRARGNDREHVALWLMHGNRAGAADWRHCRMLEALRKDIAAAIERMRLPFLPHEPLRFQLLQEQGIGYLLVRLADRAVIEFNHQAVRFISSLLGQGSDVTGRHWYRGMLDFTGRLLVQLPPAGYANLHLLSHDRKRLFEVNLHRLSKEAYILSDDCILVEMRKLPSITPVALAGPLAKLETLSPRRREVATLFAETGLSYKEIADQLGISEGTIRKHVEHIYRALGVHSRPELVALLRGRPSSESPDDQDV